MWELFFVLDLEDGRRSNKCMLVPQDLQSSEGGGRVDDGSLAEAEKVGVGKGREREIKREAGGEGGHGLLFRCTMWCWFPYSS